MAVTKEWSGAGVKVSVADDDAQIEDKTYIAPPAPGTFSVVRELVNFEVKVGSGHPQVPITFIACYNSADLSKVNDNANRLKLYYWKPDKHDPTTGKWTNIPITGNASIPSGFENFVGAKEAKITASWPDPPVAWGDG